MDTNGHEWGMDSCAFVSIRGCGPRVTAEGASQGGGGGGCGGVSVDATPLGLLVFSGRTQGSAAHNPGLNDGIPLGFGGGVVSLHAHQPILTTNGH